MAKTSLLVTFFIFLLSACSWHLQGSVDTKSVALTELNLTADDIYTPLYRTFSLEFERRRITLNNNDSAPAIKLLGESSNTRILSLNTELDPAEDEISLTVNYQVSMPKQLPQAHSLQLFRTYQQNKNRIASRGSEAGILIEEMRREAAEKILNQLVTLIQSPAPGNTP